MILRILLLEKRRFQYEEELQLDSTNYDIWFDYIRLEEAYGDKMKIREIYERAIANVPPALEKALWKRYIYLWINYAMYEELDAKDPDRARQVYNAIIKLIPHKQFSFAKIWMMFANFEIRQKNLEGARKVFGHSIGMAPSDKIFTSYIELEMQLGNIDRCRMLYGRYLEWAPENCKTWEQFAQLETSVQEYDRARAIYELSIQQPVLDMPELLWKSFIEFEIEGGEYDKARELYKKLLQRTTHVRVWLSYAEFEASIGRTPEAREIYQRAFVVLKDPQRVEERVQLIEKWREFEEIVGDDETRAFVDKNIPEKIKKKRKIITNTGEEAGWEEYYDHIFPDTASTARPKLKLLAAAKEWQKQKDDE